METRVIIDSRQRVPAQFRKWTMETRVMITDSRQKMPAQFRMWTMDTRVITDLAGCRE